MRIKGYKESGEVFTSVDDEDVRHLMGAFLSMIITNDGLDLDEDDEVDLVIVMKLAKAFFSKKHLLKAGVTGDWSGIAWELDD